MTFEELKQIWIEDLLEDYPESQDFLEKRDIVCVKCGAPVWGTVYENIAKKYVTEEEIKNTILDLLDVLN
jgi:hypothetical protein